MRSAQIIDGDVDRCDPGLQRDKHQLCYMQSDQGQHQQDIGDEGNDAEMLAPISHGAIRRIA